MTINVLPIDTGVLFSFGTYSDLCVCPADALFAVVNVRITGVAVGATLGIANVPLAFAPGDTPSKTDWLRSSVSLVVAEELIGECLDIKGLVVAAGRKIVVLCNGANAGARAYGFLRRSS